MMDEEKLKALAAEIEAVCRKHGIGIVGTCAGEQIYGEITFIDLADPESSGWRDVEKYLFNFDY